MKNLLRIEELLLMVLALSLYDNAHLSWGWFAAGFLAPDLGILGYLVGPKTGAACYNLTHHKGIAVVLFLVGLYFAIPLLQGTGLVMLAHSSFDRVLGFGLKFNDRFQHTHLGTIGKAAQL